MYEKIQSFGFGIVIKASVPFPKLQEKRPRCWCHCRWAIETPAGWNTPFCWLQEKPGAGREVQAEPGLPWSFLLHRRENKKEEVDSQVSILRSRVTDLLVLLACIDGADLDSGSLIMWNSSLGNCNCFLLPGEMYVVFRASTHLYGFSPPSDVLDQNYVWAPRLDEFANLQFWWTVLSLGTGDCPPVTSPPLQGAHQPAERGSDWTC